MNIRRVTIAALAGTVVAASFALTGAAEAAERPDGAAIVKVSSDEAKAKKIGQGRYRIILPADTSVAWFGEAGGKKPKWGTFTARGLTQGWQRLGHQRAIGVASTFIWGPDSNRSWTSALVSEPTIDDRGRLRLEVASRQSLPRTMTDLGITITRATSQPRGFPVAGTVAISGDVTLSVTATGSDATTTAFLPTGSAKTCSSFTMKGNTSHLIAGACKSVVINQGSIALLTPASGQSTSKPVPACTSQTPGNELVSLYLNGSPDSVEFVPLQWTYCGAVS